MSCVLGLLQDGDLYLASDGIATTEDGEKRPIICNKIIKNGNYIFGYTGSVRHGQLIGPRILKDPPPNVLDLPDVIRDIYVERGAIMSTEQGQQIFNSNILIGHHSRLYEILIDFQVNEILGSFTAIGSGAPYAMGSLFATKKWSSPEKRIKNALDAACEYDRSCGEPYTIEVV